MSLFDNESEDDEVSTVVDTGFHIDSMERLEYYARKMARYQMELDTIERNYTAIKSSLTHDREAFKARFDPEVEQFLIDCMQNGVVKRGKKSVQTLYGRVGLSTSSAKVKITDKYALLDHLRLHHPKLVGSLVVQFVSEEGMEFAKELRVNMDTGEIEPVRGCPGTEFVPTTTTVHVTQMLARPAMSDQNTNEE